MELKSTKTIGTDTKTIGTDAKTIGADAKTIGTDVKTIGTDTKTKVIRANKNKNLVLKMTPSGCNSDGVLELYIQKPDDMVSHAGHGYMAGCSMSLREQTFFDRFEYLEITITIEEDPRLKAFSVFNTFSTNSYGIIKHCPEKIYAGGITFRPYEQKPNWSNEADVFGKHNQTWEPYTLEFKPGSKNEIGMIRGMDDYNNLSCFQKHLQEGEILGPGYYDFDDHIKTVKLFGKDTQGFEYSAGVSILDKINKERWDNSLMPLTANSQIMYIAEAHAYYLVDWDRESHTFLTEEGHCPKRNENYTSLVDEINSKLAGVEFTEYDRVVFCKRNILAATMDSIDYESIFDEAMTKWMSGGSESESILRNSYNSVGFGVATILSHHFVTQVQHYFNVYVCVDLGKLSNIGTRQTSQESLDAVEEEGINWIESRAGNIEKIHGDNYSFEIDTDPKFALDSHNPICRTYVFRDYHPIPFSVYYLYGFYNDLSIMDDQQTKMTTFEDWPSEKKAHYHMDIGWTKPSADPRDYPVELIKQRYTTSYLETGYITKGPYRDHYGDFWRYEVNGKDVNGLCKTKYAIGDWVVIQKGITGYGESITVEWFILPSSPYYYINAIKNPSEAS